VIRSMTGYGHAVLDAEGVPFEIEIRTVNHRHLDVRARLPRGLAGFESDLRAQVAERLVRGKVDASMRALPGATPAETVELDLAAAERYLRAARELRGRGVTGDLDLGALLGLPGVARVVERDLATETVRQALLAAVGTALDSVDQMRGAEGAALDRDLRERLAAIEALVADIEGRAGDVQRIVRERLRRRSEQLRDDVGGLDEGRLHQEIVWAADRLDVTEEAVRLRSHVAQFRSLLDGAGPGRPAGRRLDFLLQEMAREANTIGSKSADAPIAHRVVDLKAELERIREQVQNVE
jgi:uncharacterized protein (TIGR00255 family)